MSAPVVIDLQHLGRPRVAAAFLVAGPEPTLVDCGTTASLPHVRAALADRGLRLGDIRHLLVTHVHLDHSGAAGAIVAEHPGLRVHVSEAGARHLVAPERLERSAQQVFGADFDRICGAIAPVPRANIEIVSDRAAGWEAFPTPGHAVHHLSFLAPDGTCYVGDAVGIRIPPSRYVVPGTPPPDIDLDAYEASFAAIDARRPARLALTHFGIADDPDEHLALMRERLGAWAEAVRRGVTEKEFVAAGEAELAGLDPETARAIGASSPFAHSYAGLRRYWSRRHAAS